MLEMDKLKTRSTNILAERQRTAASLKTRSDQSGSLGELECLQLRADIKHFVSDRKVDEDIAQAPKYESDLGGLMEHVAAFASGWCIYMYVSSW